MKKILLFLLLPVSIFAQTDFDRVPLKGKIESYTITRMYGDSLKPKSVTEKKVTYDKQGRLLTSYDSGGSGYSSSEQELNVYEGNKVTNYRCECKDVEAFAREFIIRDNAELKTMRGMPRTSRHQNS